MVAGRQAHWAWYSGPGRGPDKNFCLLPVPWQLLSFCLSTMVPIPKGSNKDLSMSKNYRGIALGSIFSKIFDNYIISAECLD